MFCYQCQETAKNVGCDVKGVCGKTEDMAKFQDLLVYVLKGLAIYAEKAKEAGPLAADMDVLQPRLFSQQLQM
jgi:hydroxylamine reductase